MTVCLGIPGRVLGLLDGYAGQLARVDVEGAARKVNVGMLETPPEPGDWVIIHMGFALEVVDAAAASAARDGLAMVGRGAPVPAPAGAPVVEDRPARVRRRFVVSGVVQGVGFRPFVYATAAELLLTGSVRNDSSGVVVEVEGEPEAVSRFGERLRHGTPPLAVVERVEETALAPVGGTGFTIGGTTRSGAGRTLASPDVATCADCLAELADPLDRRYRHPFISCTSCGPRFTVITGLPYDRPSTTMAGFALCPACRREYEDPADRRFHAQTIACPSCGPRLRFSAPSGPERADEDALAAARRVLREGGVVAVKGLGGYHLACDAGAEEAVAELRARKRRGDKPFAVMVADLEAARSVVALTPGEEAVLTGPRRPVLLLPRRAPEPGTTPVAASVAPDHPDLGVFLPYTPVHTLLLGLPGDEPGPRALVMTSGNRAGEPIVTDDAEARVRLAGLADAWLWHDRPIQVPCDDSVARFVAGAELPLRRSRGYAPLPVALPFEVPATLAVGADLKNTCAVAEGRYAWLSQHVGDMDDLATLEALTGVSRHLERLTGVTPTALVADRHPGYRSAVWAREHAAGRPVRTVQHHHAHVASVMGEHGVGRDEEVVGVALDGTGYGSDGAVWGGELLLASYATFRRAGHLAYVPLAGGDASVRRPYRMALAHLWHAGVAWDETLPPVAACPEAERRVLRHQLETGLGCVPTSSMGRLFDAVASLVGVRHVVGYEAEAAIGLEGLARTVPPDAAEARGSHAFGVGPGPDGLLRADPAPVVAAVVDDLRRGVPAALVAARFHDAVAALVVDWAGALRGRTGLGTVALSGGVFQNAVLLAACEGRLAARGFVVLAPRTVPPNDGGLALGQVLVAASRSTAGAPAHAGTHQEGE